MAQPLVLDPLLPSKLVHQFPLPTFIENLAVRPNGSLLLTLLNTASLVQVDHTHPSSPILVHKFEDVLAITGIVELGHDIFYVGAGNYNSQTQQNEFGSYSIWRVDMRNFDTNGKVKVEKVTSLPHSGLPNGFTAMQGEERFFLFADSEVGAVFKVDVSTGANEIVIQIDEMKFLEPIMPIGVNGIKVLDGYLYWTNTGKQLFCRIKIDGEAKAAGQVEVLKRDVLGDDFCFDKKGNAWVATHALNTIAVVKLGEEGDGEVVTVVGKENEMTVAGSTACHFGRGKDDGFMLYVTTTGGLTAPVGGEKVEGGKVVEIDTRAFK